MSSVIYRINTDQFFTGYSKDGNDTATWGVLKDAIVFPDWSAASLVESELENVHGFYVVVANLQNDDANTPTR